MKNLQMTSGHLTQERSMKQLFALCWVAYVITYLGRLNYGACLVEIINVEGWTKSQAGLIATGFFTTYGLGQLVNGFMGDRFSPRLMVSAGLGLSGFVNLLFPLSGDASVALLLWCVNGFVQSMIWSPLVRQLSSWLPADRRQQACVNMNGTVPVGTLAVYGLSAGLVFLGNWKLVFFTSGVLLLAMSAVWYWGIGRIETQLIPLEDSHTALTEKARNPSLWKLAMISAMPLCLLALGMQGMLKDGVTTWIPTFLEENFGLTSAASILCTTVVPIINLGGVYFASWANRKYFRNEVLAASVFFLGGLLALVLLAFFPIQSALISLMLLAVTTTCMMGINTLLASMMPHYFVQFGVCSTFTGLLNAGAYVGSALSSYGNGAIVEHFGWNSILYCWCVCAVLGAVCCLLAAKKWKRFQTANHNA